VSLSQLTKHQLKQRQTAEELVIKARIFGIMGGGVKEENEILDQAIKTFPDCYSAYVAKSFNLFQKAKAENKLHQKEGAEAQALINKAYEINPQSPQVVYSKWKRENPEANKAEIIKAMSEVLELKPLTLLEHIAHARAYEASGNTKAAIIKYKQILEMPEFGKSFEVNVNLAHLLYDLKNYTEAAIHYRNAVELEKKYAGGWTNLGNSLMELGQNAEAEVACRQAVKMQSNNLNYLRNLATSLSVQGKFKDSMDIERKILKLDPTNAQAHHGISSDIKSIADRDLQSKPKEYKKELDKALLESKLALEQDPDNALYLANSAEILIDLGRKVEALEIVVHAATSFKHMDTSEKAELGDKLVSYIASITAKQAELATELGISTSTLAEMRAAFEHQYDDSGQESPDISGEDSFNSKDFSDHS
jgi:tetratricopeptide (TPR) repeat protein